jgi:hypothetical protein
MRMWRKLGAMALVAAMVVVGCRGGKGEAPALHTLGVTLEAAGPGLVVQGQTTLAEVHVELRAGATVLQAEAVSVKDDGWWWLAWPAPTQTGAEVVVTEPANHDKVLVRGAVGTKLHEGLFYSARLRAVHVDATGAPGSGQLAVGGTSLGRKALRVELRSNEAVVAEHALAPGSQGQLEAQWPWPASATQVWFFEGDTLHLVVPIVTH